MKAKKIPISADMARELFRYDASSGRLFWRVRRPQSRVKVGDEVGHLCSNGYRKAHVGPHTILVHRIIWLMSHGDCPDQLDHINLCKSDNRLENLRPADHYQNQYNTRLKSQNSSGYKGVGWSNTAKRWHARHRFKRKLVHVGYFDTPEEAHSAYAESVRRLHGEFARVE